MTSLVPRVGVTPLRVLLALGRGRGTGLALLRDGDRFRSGDVEHPFDVCGL